MINVIAAITVKEGNLSEFIRIFKSNIPAVLKEKGCLEYTPTVDFPTDFPIQDLNPNMVTILEKWESIEDLQAHNKAPHMLAYREKVKDLVEGTAIKVLQEAGEED